MPKTTKTRPTLRPAQDAAIQAAIAAWAQRQAGK